MITVEICMDRQRARSLVTAAIVADHKASYDVMVEAKAKASAIRVEYNKFSKTYANPFCNPLCLPVLDIENFCLLEELKSANARAESALQDAYTKATKARVEKRQAQAEHDACIAAVFANAKDSSRIIDA